MKENNLDFVGALPGDSEKPEEVVRYAYFLAKSHNHLPRAYHVGMILRDTLISRREQYEEKNSFWNRWRKRRLNRKISKLEDELYIINHLFPEHPVPLEKYEFMRAREKEGDDLLKETIDEIFDN